VRWSPKIAAHHGRIVKITGDGLPVEFGSVVDAPRCADEVQTAACVGPTAIVILTKSQENCIFSVNSARR
jgi:hypothetical protein